MKTTKWFRKRMVLALVVFICGIALMGLVYIVNNKPYVYINPGIVTTAPCSTWVAALTACMLPPVALPAVLPNAVFSMGQTVE